MTLIENYIRTNGFFDFVENLVRAINKERKEKNDEFQDRVLWELWLHRVHNMDYQDFVKLSKKSETSDYVQPETLGNIVMESAAMMRSFCPE
ncbi:MAG: hypothetical protein ACI3XQ_07020 [Eubacteriales bacterium]